jgi:hypothetical protein
MLDAFFIKEVFYLSVLKLSAIITSNLLDLGIKLVLYPFKEFFSTSCVSLLSYKKNTKVKQE